MRLASIAMAWLRSGSGKFSAVHTDAFRMDFQRLNEDTATSHCAHTNSARPLWSTPWASTNLHDHAGRNMFRRSTFALELFRRAASDKLVRAAAARFCSRRFSASWSELAAARFCSRRSDILAAARLRKASLASAAKPHAKPHTSAWHAWPQLAWPQFWPQLAKPPTSAWHAWPQLNLAWPQLTKPHKFS